MGAIVIFNHFDNQQFWGWLIVLWFAPKIGPSKNVEQEQSLDSDSLQDSLQVLDYKKKTQKSLGFERIS